MNDAERDAWLREALRHAPDSGALPPHDVSEAILAEARAAALASQRARARAPARTQRAHPLVALWDWLARPPVAAGFASVMAATLVGLMWWDRPMDEGLRRQPELAGERAAAPAPQATEAAAPASQAVAPPAALPPAESVAERTLSGASGLLKQRAPAPAATRAPATETPAAKETATATPDAMPHADERRSAPQRGAARSDAGPSSTLARRKRETEALADAKVAPAEERHEAGAAAANNAQPTPFPRGELERNAAMSPPLGETKKDDDAGATRARDRADARPARAAAPAPFQEAAPSARAPADAAKATKPALDAAAPGRPAAPEAKLNAAQLPEAAAPATLGRAPVSPFASASAEAQDRRARLQSDDLEAAKSTAAAAAPLAPLLRAIAADPAQWSRIGANGSAVALEPGWRDWLAQVDAAVAGRWRAADTGAAGAAEAQGERAIALRLLVGGRPAATVRLEGTAVRVEGAAGERWLATLSAPAAARLRAAAEQLAP